MNDPTTAAAVPLPPVVRRTSPLAIPFPARLNPGVEAARRHTLGWLHGHGMLCGEAATEEYDALRLDRLMAYFYPDAGPDELALATDFNAWFFLFDDQFDGELGQCPEAVAHFVDRVVRTMDDAPELLPEEPDSPLVSGYRDIWRRITAGAPRAWQLRFRDHWERYLGAYHWEAQNRTRKGVLPLEQYLKGRRDSIGVQPCLDFTERCGGYVLPRELHGRPPLAELRRLTAEVVIFVNDVVSVDKELAAGDVNNSVIILQRSTGCTPDQAVRRIIRTANARVDQFQQIAATLPATLRELGVPAEVHDHVAHYVTGMRHLMTGNLVWSQETPRYDATGTASVSSRPWAGLFAAADPGVREA
ncbi:pentalenene synthase [Streptomyces sp. Ru73]|uniref:isoafricanol synthase n=1 Tax=Streptomyces sp. Ru73 TaxID=2080748 RepID=UPI000CDDE809|nr:isoafricanol synthase [Streptomyces sp. Ru73]POX43513.1 pentalenene synthase [Streptomyces sp. Ru73]